MMPFATPPPSPPPLSPPEPTRWRERAATASIRNPPPPPPARAAPSARKSMSNRGINSGSSVSRIASGLGPRVPLSLLLPRGGRGGEWERNRVTSLNLHANSIQALELDVDERDSIGIGIGINGDYNDDDDDDDDVHNDAGDLPSSALEDLAELDVSSNRLGEGLGEGSGGGDDDGEAAEVTAGNRSGCRGRRGVPLLPLASNLRILNLSANGLTSRSLSSVFLRAAGRRPPISYRPGMDDRDATGVGSWISLRNLSALNLSHNALGSIPLPLAGSCPNLSELNLSGNRISSLSAALRSLYPLRETLRSVALRNRRSGGEGEGYGDGGGWESANPICSVPGYGPRLVCSLRNLDRLDWIDITEEQREGSRRVVELGTAEEDEGGYPRGDETMGLGRTKEGGRREGRVQEAAQGRGASRSASASRAVARKFDAALSRIGGEGEAFVGSSGDNEGGRRTRRGGNDSGRDIEDRRSQPCGKHQDTADERASDLSINKLRRLESRVRLLSEMAGQQAEATGHLLTINRQDDLSLDDNVREGNTTPREDHSSAILSQANKCVVRVSHVSVQANVGREWSDGFGTLDSFTQTIPTASVHQQAHEKLQHQLKKARMLLLKHKAISSVLLVFQGNHLRLAILHGAFKKWCALALINSQRQNIQETQRDLEQRVLADVQAAVLKERSSQEARLYLSEERVHDVQERLDDLQKQSKEQHTHIRKQEKERRGMIKGHEKDMKILGKRAEQRLQEVINANTTKGKEEVRVLETRILTIDQKYTKEKISLEAILEQERHTRSEAESRCKDLAIERDTAVTRAKTEALRLCQEEIFQIERQAQEKLQQYRDAFEKAAKRAALDRVEKERALKKIAHLNEYIKAHKEKDHKLQQKYDGSQVSRAELDATLREAIVQYDRDKNILLAKYEKIEEKSQCLSNEAMHKDAEILTLRANVKSVNTSLETVEENSGKTIARLEETAKELEKKLGDTERAKDRAEKASTSAFQASQEQEKICEDLNKQIKEMDGVHSRKFRALNEALDDNRAEIKMLEGLVKERDKDVMSCDREVLYVKSAFEKKESIILYQHQEEVVEYKHRLQLLNENFECSKEAKITAEADAKIIATELYKERKKRTNLEDTVKKLRGRINEQNLRTQNAVGELYNKLHHKPQSI